MERGPDMERSRWRTGHEEEHAMGGVWREARIKRHGMTPRHERERGDIAP